MSTVKLGLNGKIFITLSRIFCLDPTELFKKSTNVYKEEKWSWLAKNYILRMVILTLFITSCHCKIRIYNVVTDDILNNFATYVFIACSTTAMFFAITQIFITTITAKTFLKIKKHMQEIIYIKEELYNIQMRQCNNLWFPENCVLFSVVLISFILEKLYFDSWFDSFLVAILDTYTEMTIFISCFFYFNVMFILKQCFLVLYKRCKQIRDRKSLKKFWIDYLRLQGIVEKVNVFSFRCYSYSYYYIYLK